MVSELSCIPFDLPLPGRLPPSLLLASQLAGLLSRALTSHRQSSSRRCRLTHPCKGKKGWGPPCSAPGTWTATPGAQAGELGVVRFPLKPFCCPAPVLLLATRAASGGGSLGERVFCRTTLLD